jgi:acyl-CoA reductase-like NAD-dependent aldehyde dehydrogenase
VARQAQTKTVSQQSSDLEQKAQKLRRLYADATDIAKSALVNVSPDPPVRQEEIFGPILPVLEVDDVEQVINFVNARPSPLGLYLFAEDQDVAEQILNEATSGDAVINDCPIHPLIPDVPFGGVGNSGMGKYHGEWGFRRLHERSRRPQPQYEDGARCPVAAAHATRLTK